MKGERGCPEPIRCAVLAAAVCCLCTGGWAVEGPRLDVKMVTDEAEAVLAILDRRAMSEEPLEADWSRLFTSEGYTRLEKREESLGRAFGRSEFQAFVLSDELARRSSALARSLDDWRRLDLDASARRAFAYLPEGAHIRAKVYPAIKPRTNSFVFETRTDPAIFLYLDPEIAPEKLENTIAHELHHIGVGSVCVSEPEDRPGVPGAALAWMGGFAEGRAMLAAAGSPDAHPHETSDAEERAVWDRDIGKARRDVRRLERFFLDLLDGKLDQDEQTRRGRCFISTEKVPQGAYYTVGWLMSSTVERRFGRERLVATLCDPAAFLDDYNRAAADRNRADGEHLPLWSGRLLARVRAGAPDRRVSDNRTPSRRASDRSAPAPRSAPRNRTP